MDPDFAEAHFDLGMAMLQYPDHRDEALAHFDRALQLNPGFEPAHIMIQRLREEP